MSTAPKRAPRSTDYDWQEADEERAAYQGQLRARLAPYLASKAERLRARALELGADYQAQLDAREQARDERPAREMPEPLTGDELLDLLADQMAAVASSEPDKPIVPKYRRVDGGEGEVWASNWHWSRADGALAHFDRIDRCGDSPEYISADCTPDCAFDKRRFPLGCGKRDCPSCRPNIGRKLQRQYERGFRNLQNEAKARKLDRTILLRFVTLTIPELAPGPVDGVWYDSPVVRRIEAVRAAWRVFSDKLRRHFVAVAGDDKDLCHFARVLEWTEGRDMLGHPHLHVLAHAPWIYSKPKPDEPRGKKAFYASEEWHAALESVTEESQPDLIVHVTKARRGVYQELVKYIIKDLSDTYENRFVDHVVMSEVMATMDGMRLRQTSAQFMSRWVAIKVEAPCCACCGRPVMFSHGSETSDRLVPVPVTRPPPKQIAPPVFNRPPIVQHSLRF